MAPGSRLPVVLVHGGLHGGWCWTPVLSHLRAPAVVVDLPGRGRRRHLPVETLTPETAVASVIEDADTAELDRFVLVGHSIGGLTITETALRHPARVATLVYVAAIVPRPGSSVGDVMGHHPTEMPVMAEERARLLFGTGLTDEQWTTHYARMVPESARLFNAPLSGIPADVSKTYLSLPFDVPVPRALVEVVLGNLGGDVEHRSIDGAGHTVMTTHPAELAAIIDEIAERHG